VKTFPLRFKILLALLTISAGLTCGTLALVRYRVEGRVRENLERELRNSVKTYRVFQEQQETALARTAALEAGLPTVRALMSTQDPATIRDAAGGILKDSGADLLVLADRRGTVCAVQSRNNPISIEVAQYLLNHTFAKGETRDWWLAQKRLYQVVIQPVSFGQGGHDTVLGVLVAGHEIDETATQQFGAVIGSHAVFRAGNQMIGNGLGADEKLGLLEALRGKFEPQEVHLGKERYLAATETLYMSPDLNVSLTVLKSFDQATAFLADLNQVLIALGLVTIVLGTGVGYLISASITRPLGRLVRGVAALEEGNFEYPLAATTRDEVGRVTTAFEHLRESLRRGQEDQKQLEQRLRQAHKMEAVGRLAGGVAHDFNNLLTIIRGHADLLSEQPASEAQKKSVEQIHKASNRAVGMTRQLLAFSRMQVLQPRVVDLNAIISEMGKMLPRLIGEHIEYSFQAEAKLHPVLADPGQIEQVIMNLAVNARDAMPEGGKLCVVTQNVDVTPAEALKRPAMPPGSYAVISVADTGHGMTEEIKAHIFEPFFTTKEVGKGTGLGLATVYGVVKQSNGFIWVESEPGKGTRFEIFLPATSAAESPAAGEAPETGARRGTGTVLLVEDEEDVRDLARQFLRSAGYKVLEACDGLDGLEVATRYAGPIDVLLTDMVMPRMSGKVLAGELRERRPNLKIIVMSGYSEFQTEIAERGEFLSLPKPFSMSSLVQMIEEALAASAKETAGRR